MRSLLQYCVFLLLLVVGAAPFVMMLSRNAACRAQVRAFRACFSLSACCAYVCRPRVHYDEHDLRTLRELEEPARPAGITGAYRMYQARRARMSLRLASWHEDVKKGDRRRDDLHYKLQKLHAQALESRGVDAVSAHPSATSTNGRYPPPPSSSSSSSSGASAPPAVPFDIHIVEINDRANDDDSSSERSYDVSSAYSAMPDTPSSAAATRHANVLELRSQDDEEEKDDDGSVHAVV